MRQGADRNESFFTPDFSVMHVITSSAIPMHTHSSFVVGHCFRGVSRCRIGARDCVEFHPGDTGLLNPGERHQDFVSKPERDYLNVNISRRFFEEIGGGCCVNFSKSRLEANAEVKRICGSLRMELGGMAFGREILLKSLVTELAVCLFRLFTPVSAQPYELNLAPDEARTPVARALQYLRENYTEEFELDRIARAAGLSRFYLERVFKKATGRHMHTYMIQLRLDQAKHRLASSATPIVLPRDFDIFSLPSVPTNSVSQNVHAAAARSSSRPDHRLQPAKRQNTAGRPVSAPSPCNV